MESQTIKNKMYELGADLCGIASIDRFGGAPEGYHPLDVLPMCQSVISVGVRFPVGSLKCGTPVVYTKIRNAISPKIDAMMLDFCIWMEEQGVIAVPIPTNEDELDEKTGRTRSIVSQKHAAEAAGLGTIGRHSLLITPEYGSMIWLGMALTEAKLTPDPLKEKICNHCNLCVKACPVHALDDAELRQMDCWNYAFGEEKQNWRIKCHACRDICPYNLGTKNKQL